MNPLSPALLNMLANKGILPPQDPNSPAGFQQALGNAGLTLPSGPPPGAPPPDQSMLQIPPTTITAPYKPDLTAPLPPPKLAPPPTGGGLVEGMSPQAKKPSGGMVEGIEANNPEFAPKEAGKPKDVVEAKPSGTASMQGGEGTFKLPAGGKPGTAWVDTVSPQTRALYEKALTEGKSADQAQAEAEQGANEAKADTELTQGAAAHAEAQKMAAAEKHRAKALGDMQTEVQAATKLAESGKVDPEHFWHSRTDGQKALGIVALFLHGLSGDRGPSMLERMADKDIDAQKANIANNWHSVDAKNSLLGRMMQRFGDERTAEEAARAVTFKQYALLAQSQATRSQSPILVAKAQQATAISDMKMAEFQRGAQRQVATGGGINLQAINKAVLEERSKRIAAGEPWDQAIEAKTRASIASTMYGNASGSPEVPGMQQKGTGAPKIPRGLVHDMRRFDSNTKSLDELARLSREAGNAPMSLPNQRKAAAIISDLETEGVHVPGLGVGSRWTGAELAGIQAAKATEQRKLAAANDIVRTGAGAGGGEADNPDSEYGDK